LIAFKCNCTARFQRAFEKPPAGERSVIRPPTTKFAELVPDRSSPPTEDPNRQAAALLRALAIAQHELAAFARKLQRRTDVERVTRELDIFGHSDEFPTAPQGIVSWYVEAEFRDGSSRCYGLDLFHDGSKWIIDAEITQPGSDGPEVVTQLPSRTARDIRSCTAQLESAREELQAAALRERGS
jgi:hypothetical protein